MDDELVLLTSYFNLSGGRRQDTADTLRVEPSLSSATSPDGSAALYVVTESSAGGHMGPRARRRAADVVAWEYSSHADEPPAPRLKAALRAAHEAVLSEFDGHVAVGLSVMAVEKDTVYLGQVAPAQVYVLHEGGLHSIAADAGGTSPFARGLGSTAGPQISVFRDQIGPGDVVALCSSWYHRGVEAEDLRDAFGGETADDIAAYLLDLAKQQDVRDATVIVIESVLAQELEAALEEEQPPSFMEQVDSAVQALAHVGRLIWSELRVEPALDGRNRHGAPIPDLEPSVPTYEAGTESAAAHARAGETDSPSLRRSGSAATLEPDTVEPAEDAGEPEPAPLDLAGQRPIPDQATDEVPVVPPEGPRRPESVPEVATPHLGEAPPAIEPEPPARPAPGGGAGPDRKPAREPVSELEQVNSRIQNAPDLGDIIPPVQAFPEASTEPERIYATSRDIQAVNKRPRRFGGRDVSTGPPVIRPGLSDLDLSRPASRPAPPAVIWFGIAAVFVLAAGSIAVFLRHNHVATANPYPAKVRKDIALAKSQKNPAQQDFYLQKARTNLGLAKLNGASPRTIRRLTAQVQATDDLLHHVTRVLSPVLLSDFGRFPNAQPVQIATAPGLIFVLDAGRKSLFSVTPNASSNPNLVTQTGAQVNGFIIGSLKYIATDGATVVALDDHNVLVRANAGTTTATALTTQVQNVKIVSMATADPDVYLLDAANNQIWRYPGGVTAFNPVPQAFFTSNAPNTKAAVSLSFDGASFYVLESNGSMLKFDLQTANPQKFSMNLRTPPSNAAGLYAASGLNYVWIADPAHTRVLQLDKAGGYVRTYRASASARANGMDFGQIKSLAAGPKGDTLYVLCGSKLFDFPVRR